MEKVIKALAYCYVQLSLKMVGEIKPRSFSVQLKTCSGSAALQGQEKNKVSQKSLLQKLQLNIHSVRL